MHHRPLPSYGITHAPPPPLPPCTILWCQAETAIMMADMARSASKPQA